MPTSKKSGKSAKAAVKMLNSTFGVTGQTPRNMKVKEGTTFQDLVDKFTLQGLNIRCNGSQVTDLSRKIAEGDTIVAITAVKGGC